MAQFYHPPEKLGAWHTDPKGQLMGPRYQNLEEGSPLDLPEKASPPRGQRRKGSTRTGRAAGQVLTPEEAPAPIIAIIFSTPGFQKTFTAIQTYSTLENLQ